MKTEVFMNAFLQLINQLNMGWKSRSRFTIYTKGLLINVIKGTDDLQIGKSIDSESTGDDKSTGFYSRSDLLALMTKYSVQFSFAVIGETNFNDLFSLVRQIQDNLKISITWQLNNGEKLKSDGVVRVELVDDNNQDFEGIDIGDLVPTGHVTHKKGFKPRFIFYIVSTFDIEGYEASDVIAASHKFSILGDT